MEFLINTSSPIIAIVCTAVVILLIFASRKTENTVFVLVSLAITILLLIFHSVLLETLPSTETESITQAYHCIAVDLVLILMSFLSYLWVDDIVAKKKKIKSYDDSLSWFWNKL